MEIAKQKHINIVFYASADDTLITNFSRLPMEKGLVKLLLNYSYAFTYSSEKSKGGEHEIRKIAILSDGGGSRHRRMRPAIAYREEPHLYDGSYDDDMHYQESKNTYPYELDIPGKDILEVLGYSGKGGYAGFN